MNELLLLLKNHGLDTEVAENVPILLECTEFVDRKYSEGNFIAGLS